MVVTQRIDNKFRVNLAPIAFDPPAGVAAVVDEIWNEASRTNSRLFDGEAMAVIGVTGAGLMCMRLPYRFIYAQLHDPLVKSSLQLHAAAVSGVVLFGERVLVGQRAGWLTEYADRLELVPSGSLPPGPDGEIDYRKHLLAELEEEVGIGASEVSAVEPILLIHDEDHLVYDLCCKITVAAADSSGAGERFVADEYANLILMPVAEAADSFTREPERWVPTSGAMLEAIN